MTTQIARRPVDTLRDFLEKPAAQNWLQKQAAGHIARNANDLINIIVHAAAQTPLLAQCTPTSILAALIQSAQVGLVPNTRLNHAWLVPFKEKGIYKATLIIGYEGLIKLVHDATDAVCMARVVRLGDDFAYDLAKSPPVQRHRYQEGAEQLGALTHAYCQVTMPSGQMIGDVLDRRMVMQRKASSRSASSGASPWTTHEGPMWRKSAVRHVLPLVPKGPAPKLERALEIEAQDAVDSPLEMRVEAPAELAGELEDLDHKAAEGQRAALGEAREGALDELTGAPSKEEVARAEAGDRAEQERRAGRRS